MKHIRWIFLILTAGALALIIGKHNRTDLEIQRMGSSPPSVSQREEDSHSSKRVQFPGYIWRPGQYGGWKFSIDLTASQSETVMSHIKGIMQLAVARIVPGKIHLAAIVQDVHFTRNGERLSEYEELLHGNPVILTITPQGKLVGMSIPGSVHPDDWSVFQAIYGWEFVVQSEPVYQTIEADPFSGVKLFASSYRREDEERIRKSRTFHDSTPVSTSTMRPSMESQFEAILGSMWLSALEGRERLQIDLGDGGHPILSETHVRFESVEGLSIHPELQEILGDPQRVTGLLSEFKTTGESILRRHRMAALSAKWGNVSFQEVLESIRGIADGPMAELVEPMKNFREWLEVHGAVGASLVKSQLAELTTEQNALGGLLLSALGGVDSAECHRALADVLGDSSFRPETRIQATVVAGGLGKSSVASELKDRIVPLLDVSNSEWFYKMGETALFSLSRMAEHDLESRELLVGRLQPMTKPDAPVEKQETALRAMENARLDEPGLTAWAETLRASPHPNLRAASIDYLSSLSHFDRQTLPPPESDPDPQVSDAIRRNQARSTSE